MPNGHPLLKLIFISLLILTSESCKKDDARKPTEIHADVKNRIFRVKINSETQTDIIMYSYDKSTQTSEFLIQKDRFYAKDFEYTYTPAIGTTIRLLLSQHDAVVPGSFKFEVYYKNKNVYHGESSSNAAGQIAINYVYEVVE